jgi:hypothetical protein
MDEVLEFVSLDISKGNVLMYHKSIMHQKNPMHNYNLAANYQTKVGRQLKMRKNFRRILGCRCIGQHSSRKQCIKGRCGKVTDIEMGLANRILVVIHLVP